MKEILAVGRNGDCGIVGVGSENDCEGRKVTVEEGRTELIGKDEKKSRLGEGEFNVKNPVLSKGWDSVTKGSR
jgi:hypothetical protein